MPIAELGGPPRPLAPPIVIDSDKELTNTETMLQGILDKSTLKGGKRKSKKTKNSRKINTLSEISYHNYSDYSDDQEAIKSQEDFEKINKQITNELLEKPKPKKDSPDDSKLESELSEIARNISRQSTDIHERTIVKIAKIMNLDLNNPNDNKTARYYKAAVWRMINQKHPELSNFDRSVEMEKNITKELLETIDVEKVGKEIEKHLSEKSDKKSESKEEITKNSKKESKEKTKKESKKETKEKPKKESKKESKKEPKKKSKLERQTISSDKTLSISTESITNH